MKTRLSRIALLSSCLLLSSQLLAEPKPRVHRPGQARRRFRPDLQAGPERPEGRRPAQGADARHLHARRRRRGGLQRRGRPARRGGGTITAFSSGSLLNLAQGKFGRDENRGALAGRGRHRLRRHLGACRCAYQDLDDLIAAVKKDPGSVVFGAGATIGGQDWMQTALIARAAGVDPQKLRYVAFEGGGETLTAISVRADAPYRTSTS